MVLPPWFGPGHHHHALARVQREVVAHHLAALGDQPVGEREVVGAARLHPARGVQHGPAQREPGRPQRRDERAVGEERPHLVVEPFEHRVRHHVRRGELGQPPEQLRVQRRHPVDHRLLHVAEPRRAAALRGASAGSRCRNRSNVSAIGAVASSWPASADTPIRSPTTRSTYRSSASSRRERLGPRTPGLLGRVGQALLEVGEHGQQPGGGGCRRPQVVREPLHGAAEHGDRRQHPRLLLRRMADPGGERQVRPRPVGVSGEPAHGVGDRGTLEVGHDVLPVGHRGPVRRHPPPDGGQPRAVGALGRAAGQRGQPEVVPGVLVQVPGEPGTAGPQQARIRVGAREVAGRGALIGQGHACSCARQEPSAGKQFGHRGPGGFHRLLTRVAAAGRRATRPARRRPARGRARRGQPSPYGRSVAASISIRRLYLATRSPRAGAPVFSWPHPVATARSAMKESSVSPERCDTIWV